MPIYSIRHVTTYNYRQPVAFGEHRMMLRPRQSYDQHLLEAELKIAPEPARLHWSQDTFGNWVGAARFGGRAREHCFDSAIRVAQQPSHPDGFLLEQRAQTLPVALRADEIADLRPFLERRYNDVAGVVASWARGFSRRAGHTPTLHLLTGINHSIRHGFTYIRRTERGIQEPAATLSAKAGTCRDFAVLMMEAARALGLPARFASGYLYVPARDDHDVVGGGATHAWLQIYLPGAGWVDFDPTNAAVGNAGLIRVAVAREPLQAQPLTGSFTGFASDDLGMEVTVKVLREQRDSAEFSAPLRA